VTVNGAVVSELGVRADPRRDTIAVDGEAIATAGPRRTILLHKPRGVVSTLADPEGRPTVLHLLAGIGERLFPVGRLDVNSTGLLLLTNDGALAAGLLHPRRAVPRVYHAKVRGTPSFAAITRLRRGVRLVDPRGTRKTAPARVRVLSELPTKSWLEITVTEGRWRLVRRMCDAVGHPVEKLTRVRFGPVALDALPPGLWRDVNPRELAGLRAAAGLSDGARADGSPAARRPAGTRPRKPRPRATPRRPGEPRGGGPRPAEGTEPRRRRPPRRPRP
jgi:23S rRNA pseudouridine2605 synthase